MASVEPRVKRISRRLRSTEIPPGRSNLPAREGSRFSAGQASHRQKMFGVFEAEPSAQAARCRRGVTLRATAREVRAAA